MKQFVISLIVVCMLVVGCSSGIGIFGKSSKAVDKQQTKIEQVDKSINALSNSKINQVSQLSYGMDYSLSKVTNPEPAITVTKELNDRVQSLVGLPELEQQKAMIELVSNLMSNNIHGKVLLEKKDKEIQALQSEGILLLKQKDKELEKLSAMASEVALKTDTVQAQLNDMNKYAGLGAVFYGIKKFIFTMTWWLLGFGILFLVLRVLSTVNPVFAAIFGVFEAVTSAFLHLIQALVPKAFNSVQAVETSLATKLVDTIQFIKSTSQPYVAAIQAELSKVLSDKEKATVSKIKQGLNYK